MRRSLLYFFLLLAVSSASAQTGTSLTEQLDRLVNKHFPATKCPGLSVAVAQHNQSIFSKALGKADLEQNVPITSGSVHRLASLSKPISGTIILGLVEEGKIALDVSIRQYLPELPDFYDKVTLRELLSHQSGVRYQDEAAVLFNAEHYATSRDALHATMKSLLAFDPGSKVEYSSFAFVIAAAAAEAVTGRSFQQLSSDFFAKHNVGGLFLDNPYALVPGRVRGYLVDRNSKLQFNDGRAMARDYLKDSDGEVTNAHSYDISNRYAAGGFDASADDLLRFVIAVGSGKVLKPETVAQMWTAQSTSDGARTVFGLGWGVSERKGAKMVGMNGLELSTQTFLRYLPDSGDAVVVLCNAEGTQGLDDLTNDILDVVAQ